MTGWEIRQALRTILSHDDAVIETGLAWVEPAELDRLSGLLRRLLERRQAPRPVLAGIQADSRPDAAAPG